MKIKNIFAGLMLITLSLTSCSDWFDVTSSTTMKEKVIFKNEQGFKDVFTGVYTLLTTESLYGKELTYGYNDVRGKYWNVIKSDHRYYKAMSYDYVDGTEVPIINTFWSQIYKAISNVNSILANIDNDKSIFAPGNYELYKGEAYALRAMLHFELLRLYGKSPVAEGALDSKAIPYYSKLINVGQPILSMREVLENVRKDIATARSLMFESDPYGPNCLKFTLVQRNTMRRQIKMNYWATTALLARMELYAGNKSAALTAAKEIVGEVGSLPAAPFGINNTNNEGDRLFASEFIFSLNINTLKDFTDTQFGSEAAVTSSTTGLLMKSTDYVKLYSTVSGGDLEYRKTLWMTAVDATNYTLSKYTKMFFVPMFRLSELYYIAAEASSDNETAFGYLNTIRAGRGLAPISPTSNLNTELKNEYMREFIGEGQLFYYFKRLGSIKGIGILNKTITLEQYVLPLPKNEIEFGNVE